MTVGFVYIPYFMNYSFSTAVIQTLVHELHIFNRLAIAQITQFHTFYTKISSSRIQQFNNTFHKVVRCHEIFYFYIHI